MANDLMDDLMIYRQDLLGPDNPPKPEHGVPSLPEDLHLLSNEKLEMLMGRYGAWMDYLSRIQQMMKSAARHSSRDLKKIISSKRVEYEAIKPKEMRDAYIDEDDTVAEMTDADEHIRGQLDIINNEMERLRRGRDILKQATYLRTGGKQTRSAVRYQRSIRDAKVPPRFNKRPRERFPDDRLDK